MPVFSFSGGHERAFLILKSSQSHGRACPCMLVTHVPGLRAHYAPGYLFCSFTALVPSQIYRVRHGVFLLSIFILLALDDEVRSSFTALRCLDRSAPLHALRSLTPGVHLSQDLPRNSGWQIFQNGLFVVGKYCAGLIAVDDAYLVR